MPSTRAGATPAAALALAVLPATAASAHVRVAPLRGAHLPRPRRVGARARLATPVLRRGSALLGGLALALVGTLAGASAAQAHNVLQGTDPADGSTVAVAPDHVTLTFTEPVLLVGTEIMVHDPTRGWSTSARPMLVDNTVTQAVTGELPAGVYTVIYRVTSDDGHPIEGEFAFTAAERRRLRRRRRPTAAPERGSDAHGLRLPPPPPTPRPTVRAASARRVAPAPAERRVSRGTADRDPRLSSWWSAAVVAVGAAAGGGRHASTAVCPRAATYAGPMTAPVTSAGRGSGRRSMRRPPSPWRVLVLAVAAVVAALLGVAFSGAALPALLRDPGAVVRWGLPATATLTELAGLRDARRARAGGVRAAAPRRDGVDASRRAPASAPRTAPRTRAALLRRRVRRGHLDAPVDRAPGPHLRERRRPAARTPRRSGGARRLRHADRPRPDAAADHHRRGRRHGPRARRRHAHRRRLDRRRSCSSRSGSRRSSGTPPVRPGTTSRRRRWWSTWSAPPSGSVRSPRSRCWSGAIGTDLSASVARYSVDRRLVLRRRRRVRAGQRPAADQRLGRPHHARTASCCWSRRRCSACSVCSAWRTGGAVAAAAGDARPTRLAVLAARARRADRHGCRLRASPSRSARPRRPCPRSRRSTRRPPTSSPATPCRPSRPRCAGSPSGAGTWCSRPRPSPGWSSTGAGCCGCGGAATRGRWSAPRPGPSAWSCSCGRPTAAPNLYGHVLFSAHMVQHMTAGDGRAAVPRAVRARHPRAARAAGPLDAAARRRLPRPARVDPRHRPQPRRAVPRAPRRRRRELHRLDAALLLLRPVRVVAAQPRRAPRDGRALHAPSGTCSSTRSSASTPVRSGCPTRSGCSCSSRRWCSTPSSA